MLIIHALTAFIISFLTTFLSIPKVATFMKNKGIVGIDVHKLDKPKIPEMVGISMLIGFSTSLVFLSIAVPNSGNVYLAVLLSIVIAAFVGFLDDFRDLSPTSKIFLALLSGFPILILKAYNPRPIIPFIGRVRLTIAYPLAIPIALSVTANAMNMSDPVNGAMSGSALIIMLTLTVAYLLTGNYIAFLTGLALTGAILAFYLYNRFPAKVFSGNVGSFAVGAAIGGLVVTSGLEIVAVIAMLPQILNSYMILSTGGFRGKKNIIVRPTRLLENGLIEVVKDQRAPLTLVRMILANSAKTEREIAREFLALTLFSSILALITLLVMPLGG
jgi:UDP-N-acetylglucosamine--dolichyl-phosphate N-acetylglucosaminephosphotransferase